MIDIHVHTSDKELWGLHTKSATLDDLEKYAEEHGVEKIVLLATYFPYKKSGVPNHELLRRIGERDKFFIFASLDAMNNLEDGTRELRELAGKGIVKGIKLYPGYQNFRLRDETLFPIYELAAERNLPIAVHSGELHHCCQVDATTGRRERCGGRCYIDEQGDFARPGEVLHAARSFPEVKFLMCHLGNPFFSELRDVMRECPNVYTDTSGQFTSGTDEDSPEYRFILAGEMREFLKLPNGSERVIFGSDFPIQSYEDSIALIKSLRLPKEVEENIFHRNARKLLNI